MPFTPVVPLSDLTPGEVLGVEVGGVRVCLARVDDEVFAFRDNCSHRDFPLSNGEVDADDCTITCEWHGAMFDMRTGAPRALPATRPIQTYACKLEDGHVLVDVG